MKNQIKEITGLKGIACFLVFTSHCYWLLSRNSIWMDYASDFGRLGVLIFFFLSGYLIIFNSPIKTSTPPE